MAEISLGERELFLVDLIVKTKFASSKSEARRLVAQGGVKINGVVQRDPQALITPAKGMVLQAGKRRFVAIA
ncbi:MAG: tyrosyl-tRNA synthetase [Parcubacteria group bacterium Greene0416_39]|nr:MAG: tyrosyl-tRNA synthetase [Parcubacteria group bacterium Greene0416_39]